MASNVIKLQCRLHNLKYKYWLAKIMFKFRMIKLGTKIAEDAINKIEYRIDKGEWKPLYKTRKYM